MKDQKNILGLLKIVFKLLKRGHFLGIYIHKF